MHPKIITIALVAIAAWPGTTARGGDLAAQPPLQTTPTHGGVPSSGGGGGGAGVPSAACAPVEGNGTVALDLPAGGSLELDLDRTGTSSPILVQMELFDDRGVLLATYGPTDPPAQWFSLVKLGDGALIIAAAADAGTGGGGLQQVSELIPAFTSLVPTLSDGSLAPVPALTAFLAPQVSIESGCVSDGDQCEHALSSTSPVKNVVVQPIGTDKVSVTLLYVDGGQDKQIWKKNPDTGVWECTGSGEIEALCDEPDEQATCLCQFLASTVSYGGWVIKPAIKSGPGAAGIKVVVADYCP